MTTPASDASSFGAELRRRRLAAGLSLSELSSRTHYSRGYISRIETGDREPSVEFARRLDAALGAEGVLALMLEPQAVMISQAREPFPNPDATFDLSWIESFHADTASRRSYVSDALVRPDVQDQAIESFADLLDRLKSLGQVLAPSNVMPMLVPQVVILVKLAQRADDRIAPKVWRMASRFADYAGWMAQEMGSDETASRWTDQAVIFARLAGDNDAVAYAYVRRANIALYQHDARMTVNFAVLAQKTQCGSYVQRLACQREAQGYALAGDRHSYIKAMARAEGLLANEPDDEPQRVQLGSQRMSNPLRLAKGWSLHDLGLSEDAVPFLRDEYDATHASNRRARARIGARLALALAASHKLDKAAEVLEDILSGVRTIESATIRADLKSVNRILNRWHGDESVLRVSPILSAALMPSASIEG
ncbi:helix-turn-helix domain-containing protein [Catenuloplanes indicus]|uniref:helix-turn-helix domain-containing protein n=1 Tax=Catenuloplanes indicus TaxID=137267 RepID=UPI0027D8428F|nr:helix-turn-helix transcriptional regulator [Catenuloplanes indicus]